VPYWSTWENVTYATYQLRIPSLSNTLSRMDALNHLQTGTVVEFNVHLTEDLKK
jgi:hypothetical protein